MDDIPSASRLENGVYWGGLDVLSDFSGPAVLNVGSLLRRLGTVSIDSVDLNLVSDTNLQT